MKNLPCLVLAAALLAVPANAADTFPVAIPTAFGDVTIPSKPERVVTWGWSAQDVALDLGVVPVGIPFFRYGGKDDGILPWTEEKVAAMGAEMPVVLPESAQVPIEAIAALDPDVIIAPYSGLTPEEYELLSQIAPVVAYPEKPWFATWQEVVTMTGAALGLSDEAAALVADTDRFMKDAAAAYPDLQGIVFANVLNRNDGQVAVRTGSDPRVRLFADIGMTAAPDASSGVPFPGGFSYALSYENFDQLQADMLVTFFDTTEAADAFFALPYIVSTPLVQSGAYARMEGEEITMAVSGAVTPLSLRWGFEDVIGKVGVAAAKAKQQ
jgi:iron complex transport system substrate-binding protein